MFQALRTRRATHQRERWEEANRRFISEHVAAWHNGTAWHDATCIHERTAEHCSECRVAPPASVSEWDV